MTGDSNAGVAPPSPFERFSTADIFDLIGEYPLAWVAPGCGHAAPSLLPLLAERGADGGLAALLGHMGRRNPLVSAFGEHGEATILFTGPQAYLSTALVSDPRWAPTWVYAQLNIRATLRFVPEETGAAVQRLTARLEGRAGTGWQPDMVGPRYGAMERAIIAFRAEVASLSGRFKLCQDESPERLAEIAGGLSDRDLLRWIDRFNPGRRR